MKKTTKSISKAIKCLLVFGIIFSQLSFPLSVLADEMTNNEIEEIVSEDETPIVEQPEIDETMPEIIPEVPEESTTTYKIIINNEETTNYILSNEGEKKVTIVLDYDDKVKEDIVKEFDFTEKLYGTYEYTFETENETITINYEGDNIELLNEYLLNGVDSKVHLICTITDGCLIRGASVNGVGNEIVTVADITTNYFNIEEFENKYQAKLNVTSEGEILSSDALVMNGYNLDIEALNEMTELKNITPKSTYEINRLGDEDNNSLIDELDQNLILDAVLNESEITKTNDVNRDGVLDITDASYMPFIDGSWDFGGEFSDVLKTSLIANNDTLSVDETIEVKLIISGLNNNVLYGIEGLLNYNNELLELEGIFFEENVKKMGDINLENNKFAFVLNGFKENDTAVMTLRFKALKEGTTEIAINNIVASRGVAFELENESVSKNITINDYGKGGNEAPEETTTNTNEVLKENSTSTSIPTQTTKTYVSLSGDNYIKLLTIKGYEIDFNQNTYEYSIKVKNDISALELLVQLNSDKAIYYVEGNEDFKVGENIVSIVVKAENGSTRTYTIKVEKEEKETKVEQEKTIEEDEEESSSASKTVIIILIVLVIIGLIYVIFKDDEEEKQETKKESKKETKKGSKK